jgi:hypothetical protein
MLICEVCGNDIELAAGQCPYCGSAVRGQVNPPGPARQRLINLERGLPTVEQALRRLDTELESSRLQGYRILTLIHGYGSSGKGGAIRDAVRRQLRYYQHQGRVNTIVTGEEFSSRTGPGRHILRRFPVLDRHADLNRANQGVTLVILP